MSQEEVSKRRRIEKPEVTLANQNRLRHLKNVEISVPIAFGTISFWRKKAGKMRAHKWTVYIRSANNEDLSPIISKVVFQLDPSFNNPTRIVETAPFELSECGWGEFGIGITVYFQRDADQESLQFSHDLKLEKTEEPVVAEAYEEIVFREPTEAFYRRVKNLPAVKINGSSTSGPTDDNKQCNSKLSQWFLKYSETEELALLMSARQQVQRHIDKLRLDQEAIDKTP